MKFLSWIALIIAVVVAIISFPGVTIGGLDWVVRGLAVSVILLAIGQIVCHCCKCKQE